MMSHIIRYYENKLHTLIKPNKVLVLLGARRVGKKVLIANYLEHFKDKYLLLNGEDADIQELLKRRSSANYKRLLNGISLLVIDEAQGIENIAKVLKLMVDEIKGIKILVTGSSGFDLLNKTGEPLSGRMHSLFLYPIAQIELSTQENILVTKQNQEERLIYGSYPELFNLSTSASKESYLKELISSYLLKDIFALEGIRNANKIMDLLKLLAYQIGKDVSYHELGQQLGMSKNTIEKYLDLLTKCFVLVKCSSFNKNLRKEISKGLRWYFNDNGIRNAIINDFKPIALRRDIGELWENYLINERIKSINYKGINSNNYFWRTYDQQEIDWIEETNGKLCAYEFKYRKNTSKIPIAWKNTYPQAKFTIINQDNYLKFIS